MLSEEMELKVTPAAVKAVHNIAHDTAEVLLQWLTCQNSKPLGNQ